MKEIILDSIKAIHNEFSIKILYACESGSRAWGFASPDSDYDVRFIYVHAKDFYLGIDEQRDVIELPINNLLDINGWELRKALRLFRKSNGPLYEWLQSPIVYQNDENFVNDLTREIKNYFSPRAMMHHYLSMTKTVVDNDLSESSVRLKKYFYALRPILAARWIADKQEVPPMEFGKLRELLDPALDNIVDSLLTQKSKVDEKFLIAPINEIHQWIVEQINYCEAHVPEKNPVVDNNALNHLFRKYLI